MELNEIKENAKKMLSVFMSIIGYDGAWYSELNTTPLVWGVPEVVNSPGEYVSINDERIKDILMSNNIDEKTKEAISQQGMIIINKFYKKIVIHVIYMLLSFMK